MFLEVRRRTRRRIIVLVATLATALGVTVAGITQASAADTLLSQGKPATASSTEGGPWTAAAAVDGNTGTRWSSQFSDPQWLQVDLGASATISQVVLRWEAAYGRSFQIQASANASTWTTIFSTTSGTGGTQTLNVTGSGRYVRMYGTARGTGYGYSLWEFQVFGTIGGGTPTTPPTTPPVTGTPVEPTDPRNPNFGPNVNVYDPSTPASTIQSRLNQIFTGQETNQFGPQRYAVLFKPGNYTADANLGFFTQVAGLGMSPDDVNLNGHVRVEAFWMGGNATQNFWRTAENLSVTLPAGVTVERYAVSQAAPYRRMHLRGAQNQIQLWNGGDGWSSGGLMADTKVDGAVVSGSQQQWYSRNSEFGSWSGSVWNMVFQGVQGAPPNHFPNPSHTVIATTPVVREKPFLFFENGEYKVFVPALRQNSSGTSWFNKTPAGTKLSLADFFIVRPGASAATINNALAQGKNLLVTPGTYHVNQTINVTRPDTVVLGLGLATFAADNGVTPMKVADVAGVKVAGIMFDAGPTNSPSLMEVGAPGSSANNSGNPISLHDVFFRIGGPGVGKATNTLIVNSNHVIGDHMWLWRADHGSGVGWTVNTADQGLVVNGNDVTMYGLFVEHFQKYQTVWNGERGRTYFYQNEFPYEMPNQAAWMNGSTRGYAAYKVADSVNTHQAWGLGSYCVFTLDESVVAERSFEAPVKPGIQFTNMVTVSLGGQGTINRIINDKGGTARRGAEIQYLTTGP
jgi:hypothetical protein